MDEKFRRAMKAALATGKERRPDAERPERAA
jgi:hypothetical protein